MALVEGSCQPGAGQEARSPVILGVRRSETVSPIFTLMTLVETNAVVGRSTLSRKQTKVTNASAMLPMKHCATERQRFDFQWLLVCICQMGR